MHTTVYRLLRDYRYLLAEAHFQTVCKNNNSHSIAFFTNEIASKIGVDAIKDPQVSNWGFAPNWKEEAIPRFFNEFYTLKAICEHFVKLIKEKKISYQKVVAFLEEKCPKQEKEAKYEFLEKAIDIMTGEFEEWAVKWILYQMRVLKKKGTKDTKPPTLAAYAAGTATVCSLLFSSLLFSLSLSLSLSLSSLSDLRYTNLHSQQPETVMGGKAPKAPQPKPKLREEIEIARNKPRKMHRRPPPRKLRKGPLKKPRKIPVREMRNAIPRAKLRLPYIPKGPQPKVKPGHKMPIVRRLAEPKPKPIAKKPKVDMAAKRAAFEKRMAEKREARRKGMAAIRAGAELKPKPAIRRKPAKSLKPKVPRVRKPKVPKAPKKPVVEVVKAPKKPPKVEVVKAPVKAEGAARKVSAPKSKLLRKIRELESSKKPLSSADKLKLRKLRSERQLRKMRRARLLAKKVVA